MWKEFLWNVSWELQTTKVRWWQIQAAGKVWNNFKLVALYRCWSGSTSVWCSIITLRIPPPHDRHDWSVLSASLQSSFNSQSWFSSIFFNKLVKFLFIQIVSCSYKPFRMWLVIQFQISALMPQVNHPWCTVLMLQVLSPQKENNHWWILVGVPYFCIKKSVTACCLVCNTTVENKSSILNWLQHKPLGYQAIPQGKLKPMEQWTSWYKYCFKVTSLVWDTCMEALLFEHPTYKTQSLTFVDYIAYFYLYRELWLDFL